MDGETGSVRPAQGWPQTGPGAVGQGIRLYWERSQPIQSPPQ